MLPAELNDFQRRSLAVKCNAFLTFDQAAVIRMPMVLISIHEDDDELQPTEDDLPGPESDGQGILTYMLSDPDHEHDEEEANLFGPTTTMPVRMPAKSSRRGERADSSTIGRVSKERGNRAHES